MASAEQTSTVSKRTSGKGARELVAPKRIIEFAAEWYETQMGRFTGRIEGEDEAAADEIDKILNS